jgi:hypothetical protein
VILVVLQCDMRTGGHTQRGSVSERTQEEVLMFAQFQLVIPLHLSHRLSSRHEEVQYDIHVCAPPCERLGVQVKQTRDEMNRLCTDEQYTCT